MFRPIYQLRCTGHKLYFNGNGAIYSKTVYFDRDIAEGAKAGFRTRCVTDDGSLNVDAFATLQDLPSTVVQIVELELFE